MNVHIKILFLLLVAWVGFFMLEVPKMENWCFHYQLMWKIVTKYNGTQLLKKYLLLVEVMVFWNYGIILCQNQIFLLIELMMYLLIFSELNTHFGFQQIRSTDCYRINWQNNKILGSQKPHQTSYNFTSSSISTQESEIFTSPRMAFCFLWIRYECSHISYERFSWTFKIQRSSTYWIYTWTWLEYVRLKTNCKCRMGWKVTYLGIWSTTTNNTMMLICNIIVISIIKFILEDVLPQVLCYLSRALQEI